MQAACKTRALQEKARAQRCKEAKLRPETHAHAKLLHAVSFADQSTEEAMTAEEASSTIESTAAFGDDSENRTQNNVEPSDRAGTRASPVVAPKFDIWQDLHQYLQANVNVSTNRLARFGRRVKNAQQFDVGDKQGYPRLEHDLEELWDEDNHKRVAGCRDMLQKHVILMQTLEGKPCTTFDDYLQVCCLALVKPTQLDDDDQ